MLENSLARSGIEPGACGHVPFRPDDRGIVCFFRDDGLSDRIGFSYQSWRAADAVDDVLRILREIHALCEVSEHPIVPVILDGENAWEHYAENGYAFLRQLYDALADAPDLELTTFSDYLEDAGPSAPRLPRVVPGSWVYGTLSTWIGEDAKNRLWERLIEAKVAYDETAQRLETGMRERAERQLAVCEGSDWFWWPGDHGGVAAPGAFERLHCLQLARLYELLGVDVPTDVAACLAAEAVAEAAPVMRPGRE